MFHSGKLRVVQSLISTALFIAPLAPARAQVEFQLPRIIANHDLWCHSREESAEGAIGTNSTVGKTTDYVADQVANFNSKLDSNQSTLSLNMVYGSRALWGVESSLTGTSETYGAFTTRILGNLSANFHSRLTTGHLQADNIMESSLRSSPVTPHSILSTRLLGRPWIVSYRINDHHHLKNASSLLNAEAAYRSVVDSNSFVQTSEKTNLMRALAAVTPAYLTSLSEIQPRLISRRENEESLGRNVGAGTSCKEDSYQYDFASPEIVNLKLNELRALFESSTPLSGVEIDFTRNACLFNKNTPTNQKVAIMTSFLNQIIQFRDQRRERTNFKTAIILKIPAKTALLAQAYFGLSLPRLGSNAGIDAIIIANPVPLLPSQVPAITFRSPSHPTLKVYLELYQAIDSDSESEDDGSRREATSEMIYSTALLARNQGYDGVSLMNFQYWKQIEKDNRADNLAEWQNLQNGIASIWNGTFPESSLDWHLVMNQRNNMVGNVLTLGNGTLAVSADFGLPSPPESGRSYRFVIRNQDYHQMSLAEKIAWRKVVLRLVIPRSNGTFERWFLSNSASTSSSADFNLPLDGDTSVRQWDRWTSKEKILTADQLSRMNGHIQVELDSDPDKVLVSNRRIQFEIQRLSPLL